MVNRELRVQGSHALNVTGPTFFCTSVARPITYTSLFVLLLISAMSPLAIHGQMSATNGWVIQLTGMIQVEPGSNVVEMEVKGIKLRFAVHDLYSSDRNFSVQQFLSELRRTSSSMRIRSAEDLQELLLAEKPSRRVLKLGGRYYPDSRLFLLDRIDSLPNKPPPEL